MNHVAIIQPVLPKYEIPLLRRLNQGEVRITALADLETRSQLNQYDRATAGFDAVHLGTRRIGPFVVRPGLFRKIRALKPDVIVINGDPREISQLLLAVWARVSGVPVGVWSMFHRIGPRRIYTEMYMRVVGRVGNLLLSYGEKGRREQIRRGINREKIIVLSTAVDEQPIIQTRDSVSDGRVQELIVREALQGKRILLHVVRLTAIKNPEFMVKAFAVLAAQRNDVVLVWIGGGPLEERVRQLSMELGVLDRMRFVGPVYDEEILALWFKAASVFVMATCIGLSIHHAMCYGLPVVTDDSELTQTSEFEVLQDGINGLVYKAGDPEDFARKISSILDDDELRGRLSMNAMRRIEEDYTFEKKCANFRLAFQRLSAKN